MAAPHPVNLTAEIAEDVENQCRNYAPSAFSVVITSIMPEAAFQPENFV